MPEMAEESLFPADLFLVLDTFQRLQSFLQKNAGISCLASLLAGFEGYHACIHHLNTPLLPQNFWGFLFGRF